MSGSPQLKVYDRDRGYMAAVKEPEAAAALCDFYGEGTTVRFGHRKVIWTEGSERVSANESYDEAAEIMHGRISNPFTVGRRRNPSPAQRTQP